jgi:hypothetical protein
MIPNNIAIGIDGVKFRLSWLGPLNAKGYIVSAARDPEFTTERRCLFVPCAGAAGVCLDMGGGVWYFRIATLVGDSRGDIRWSNVYGPYVNEAAGTKGPPPNGATSFSVLHTRSIQGGLRVHVHYDRSAYIMILETSRYNEALRATETEWSFHVDTIRRGSVDALNLEYPHTYWVRCTLLDGAAFPTDAIVPLGAGIRVKGVPEKPVRHFDNSIQSLHRGDVAILRQTESERNVRFSSHADYLRYQAAKARTGTDSVRR